MPDNDDVALGEGQLNEAEIAKRIETLKRLPQYAKLPEAKLRRMVLRKVGAAMPIRHGEDLLQEDFLPLFRREKKKMMAAVSGDLNPVFAEKLVDIAVKGWIVVMYTDSGRDLKEAVMASVAAIRELGQTKPERRKDNIKKTSELEESLAASSATVKKIQEARARGRTAVTDLLVTKGRKAPE